MSDEIVRRLMEAKKSVMRFDEADDDDEDDVDYYEPDEDEDMEDDDETISPSEDMEDDSHAPSLGNASPHITHGSSAPSPEPPAEPSPAGPEPEPEPEETESSEPEEYVNPLDNSYAVHYTIGDEVLMSYANGTNSELAGTIDGYDPEGFYRVQWKNGLTTNGITDIALADFVGGSKIKESKCICGSSNFINEGKKIICDNCGRRLKRTEENKTLDQLTIADKSRPKGKRMIRSEAHPMSTADKPSIDISEAIKSALKNR